MLFEHDPILVHQALNFGVSTFLVDWESRDKAGRQAGFDTEINPSTLDNLHKVCAVPGAKAWCRVNGWGPWSSDEIEAAISAGVRGLFLPMARRVGEVEDFLAAIGGRCEAAILIETTEAVEMVADLARLPLNRVYFGLNDFAICRGRHFIFDAVKDGIVAQTRKELNGMAFGFGGATAVDLGSPVPCRKLLEEMARIDCQFTFLRRSFKKDIASHDPAAVIAGIQACWRDLRNRPPAMIESDLHQLLAVLEPLCV
ncbi:hypothetical protein [Methylomagnum sp.]